MHRPDRTDYVDRNYIRALLSQSQRMTAPLTSSGTGDERHLAFYSSHDLLLLVEL
jgi:hypothetical protein